MVVDTVGGANLDKSFEAAGFYGRVVGTAGRSTNDLSPMHAKSLSLSIVFVMIPMLYGIGRARHGRILHELAELVEGGKLRPLIDERRFTLEQVPDAYRYLESGQATGKVVIDII